MIDNHRNQKIPKNTKKIPKNTKHQKHQKHQKISKTSKNIKTFFGSQKKIELFFCQRGNDVTQRTDQTNRTNDVFH